MTDISHGHAHSAGAAAAPWVRNLLAVSPSFCAAAYPFLLRGFRAEMTWSAEGPAPLDLLGAAVFMGLAFAVPAFAFFFAYRTAGIGRATAFQIRARRLAYLTVGVPPLYVLFGVLNGFVGRPVTTEWGWAVLWLAGSLWASVASAHSHAPQAPADNAVALGPNALSRLRVGHGIVAATILAFVVFHLGNHMAALNGQAAHTAVMDAGRAVYRQPVVETIIVVLLLLQVAGGITLAWRWSASPADIYRVFQIASGAYLASFILCHLNSIFVNARLVLKIPTDWAFMTSQPAGLLHSSGNLIPHYTLGAFFILGHLASGARHVALTHGFARATVNRIWGAGVALSMIIAVMIMVGLCGVTLRAG